MQFIAAAGLVMILSGLGAYYATGEQGVYSIANLVGGPLLLAAAALVAARRFRGFSGAHPRRVALRSAALGVGVLALVLAANLLARGWGARLDLTVERSYTLAPQTLETCARLDAEPDEPAPELLFFEDSKLARDVRLLVESYATSCPRLRTRELTSAEAPPSLRGVLEGYEVTVAACLGTRCEPVGYPSEQNITSALLRLTRRTEPRVYFTVGHGEVDLASESEHGFAGLVASLAAEGITARALVTASRSAVPEDAAALIIAAPERDWLPAELEALDRYLDGGGRLLTLLEPGQRLNLLALLARWGFELPDGVVVDLARTPLLRDAQPISLLVHLFDPTHAVTRALDSRTMIVLPGVRPVLYARKPRPEDRLHYLAYATARAWVERDVAGALAGRRVERDPDEAGGRELPIAAAGRYPRGEREARIVVIGDRDFASNRLIGSLYNRDLLLNSVLWLIEDETRISIRPKGWTPIQAPLTLQQSVAYFYLLAFALPELLLLLGIRAWYRQRL